MLTQSTAQATAYIPLIARAAAAELCPDTDFVDDYAQHAIDVLGVHAQPSDYNVDMMRGCVMRAQLFDELCLRYIHERATQVVIEVGAGFETRPQRLAPRLDVPIRWIHVDLPEVVESRRVNGLDRDVTVVAADASTAGWTHSLGDLEGPCVLLSEGLTYHLNPGQVRGLLTTASAVLGSGSVMIHDFMSPLMRRVHPGRKEVIGGFRSSFRSGADLFRGIPNAAHLYDRWDLEAVNRATWVAGYLLRRLPTRRWRSGMYGVAVGEVGR